MLMDEMRRRRRAGDAGEGCEGWRGCEVGMSRLLEAATEATSAMALNVARRRENEGAFVSGGRFSEADGVGGGARVGLACSTTCPKSPSSSLSDDKYMEPQLGSSRPGVGERDWEWCFR